MVGPSLVLPLRRGSRARALLLAAMIPSGMVLSAPRTAYAESPEEPRNSEEAGMPAADPKSPNIEAARAHFFRGVKYYEGGDYRWALLEFQRAFELSGNYRILYNLARVSEELNTYAEATRAFEEYLRLGGDDIDKQRQQEVERELETLRPKLAHLTLSINVEGAEAIVDNKPFGESPLSKAIVLDAGEHFITVRHDGYVEAEKRVVVAAGDTLQETLTLQKEPTQTPTAIAGREKPGGPAARRDCRGS